MMHIPQNINDLPLHERTGEVLQVYVDAVGWIESVPPGDNMRMTFVEVRIIGDQYYRVPVLEIIRPTRFIRPALVGTMMEKARRDGTSYPGRGIIQAQGALSAH